MESRDYSDQSEAEQIVKQGATTEIGESDLKLRALYTILLFYIIDLLYTQYV